MYKVCGLLRLPKHLVALIPTDLEAALGRVVLRDLRQWLEQQEKTRAEDLGDSNKSRVFFFLNETQFSATTIR